jgi:hypothetical protein
LLGIGVGQDEVTHQPPLALFLAQLDQFAFDPYAGAAGTLVGLASVRAAQKTFAQELDKTTVGRGINRQVFAEETLCGHPLDSPAVPAYNGPGKTANEGRAMAEQLPAEFTMTVEWDAGQAMVLPLSCDLTGDRTACAILRQWARRPWESIHPAALLDRMEELGDCERGKAQVRRLEQQVLPNGPWPHHKRTRTSYHRWLKLWKAVLIDHFGDFESQTDTL